MALCPKCHGTGIHTCHRCEGQGRVAPDGQALHGGHARAVASAMSAGDTSATVRCPSCHGVGTETCRSCDGAGEV